MALPAPRAVPKAVLKAGLKAVLKAGPKAVLKAVPKAELKADHLPYRSRSEREVKHLICSELHLSLRQTYIAVAYVEVCLAVSLAVSRAVSRVACNVACFVECRYDMLRDP